MVDILCVGDAVIDFTPWNECGVYVRNAGGAPANVAIAIARMGCSSAFCGKVGNDIFGEYLLKTIHDNGVFLYCGKPSQEAATTMTFVDLSPDGNRSFTFAQKIGAHLHLEESEITPEMIRNAKIVHTSSTMLYGGTSPQAVLHALRMAKENNVLVSFDINYRALQWKTPEDCRNQIIKLLPFVDMIKISNEESFLFGGDDKLLKIMEQYDIQLMALTRGASPASVYWDGKKWNQPCIGNIAVDTTGAGDAFWGVFLSVIIERGIRDRGDFSDDIIDEALRYAVAAGELSILKYGAIASLPYKTEVEEALKLYG